MRDKILKLINDKPKHYAILIKKDEEMMKWVDENTKTSSDNIAARVYSAVNGESDVCVFGNTRKFTRFSTGFSGCGPASKCECTRNAISCSVTDAKSQLDEYSKSKTNEKRNATMLEKYGVAFNSQRLDIKHIWTESNLDLAIEEKLNNRAWMENEYVVNRRASTDIAAEVGVHYSTVVEYCKKHGFQIRGRSNRLTTGVDNSDFTEGDIEVELDDLELGSTPAESDVCQISAVASSTIIQNSIPLSPELGEKDTIIGLIQSNPKQYSIMTKRRPELWEWVMEQTGYLGDIDLPDFARIFAAVSGSSPICERGNVRKLRSINDGAWVFCGNAGVCECAKKSMASKISESSATRDWDAVIDKRRATNLEKYGHINAAQTPAIIQKHKDYYADPVKSAKAVENLKATCMEKYGVTNPNKLEWVRDKIAETNIDRYGVKNVKQCPEINSKIHMTRTKRAEESNGRYLIDATYESMVRKLKSIGYTLNVKKEDYNGTKVGKYSFTHDMCGTHFTRSFNGLRTDTMCPHCFYTEKKWVSGEEQSVMGYIESLGIPFTKSRQDIINPYHLDIYIPSFNLAIEYNGLYWHSEKSGGKDTEYHWMKMDRCNKVGLQLISIFSDEWLEKQDIVKSILSNRFGKSQVIEATACEIRELAIEGAWEFFDKNHIDGGNEGTVAIGLFWQDELIAAINFAPDELSGAQQWQLVQYCPILFKTVNGGLKRLIDYFVEKYRPSVITAINDARWFQGTTFTELGFTYDGITDVHEMYTDYIVRLPLEKMVMMERYNDVEMEINPENALDVNKLDRVWDCGNHTFHKKFE